MRNYTTQYDKDLVEQIIAEFVKQCNYILTSSLKGQLYVPAKNASQLCKKYNVDAAFYVEAHMNHAPVLRGYTNLIPAQLYCTESALFIEHHIANKKSNPEQEFNANCRLFMACLTGGWDANACLSDLSFDFAPWFRILMSPERNEELIRNFGAKASHILNHSGDLAKYLKSIKTEDGKTLDMSRIPNYS